MKVYKTSGKGLRTSLLAIMLAIFSLGGFFNHAFSNVFFYIAVFSVIILVVAFVRVFSRQGNKMILLLSTAFVALGLSFSYYFCYMRKMENIHDPQILPSELSINFRND